MKSCPIAPADKRKLSVSAKLKAVHKMRLSLTIAYYARIRIISMNTNQLALARRLEIKRYFGII